MDMAKAKDFKAYKQTHKSLCNNNYCNNKNSKINKLIKQMNKKDSLLLRKVKIIKAKVK